MVGCPLYLGIHRACTQCCKQLVHEYRSILRKAVRGEPFQTPKPDSRPSRRSTPAMPCLAAIESAIGSLATFQFQCASFLHTAGSVDSCRGVPQKKLASETEAVQCYSVPPVAPIMRWRKSQPRASKPPPTNFDPPNPKLASADSPNPTHTPNP